MTEPHISDATIAGVKVCTLCGSPAEYIPTEGIWRHKGDPFDSRYIAQSFCSRYGYSIEVKDAIV